jgi:hypothetical protein
MSWRLLIWIPLVALALGRPNHPPHWKPPIADLELPECDYGSAKRKFLLAYGYWTDRPLKASELFSEAEYEQRKCGPAAAELGARMKELKRRFAL